MKDSDWLSLSPCPVATSSAEHTNIDQQIFMLIYVGLDLFSFLRDVVGGVGMVGRVVSFAVQLRNITLIQ